MTLPAHTVMVVLPVACASANTLKWEPLQSCSVPVEELQYISSHRMPASLLSCIAGISRYLLWLHDRQQLPKNNISIECFDECCT